MGMFAMKVKIKIVHVFLALLLVTGDSIAKPLQIRNYFCEQSVCEIQNVRATNELEFTRSLGSHVLDIKTMEYRQINFSDYREIRCRDSTFERIPPSLFEKFSRLQVLNASSVGLVEISRDDFRAASYLNILDLSGNMIKSLVNVVFMYLTQLSVIRLSRNQIESIHDGAFEYMSRKLWSIDLSFNKIPKFNENHLINMAKKTTEKLSVDLSQNIIDEIVQSSAVASGNIKLLDLQYNQVKVFELTKLKIAEINLSNNQIENFTVSDVQCLNLNNNKLKDLLIGRTTKSVSAINNEIRELKCDKNSTIEELFLSGNKMTSKVFEQLKYADKLKILDVSENLLGPLNVDSLAELTSLEVLSLGNSSIDKISFGLFSHQKNLRTLNISYNSLGFIDYHMFTSLSNLTTWDISGNNLTKLKDYENFRGIFQQLSSISLDQNHWSCEYLSKMRLNLEKQAIKVANPINPVKTDSNVNGIGCSIKSNPKTENSTLQGGNAKISQDNLISQLNELKSNLTKLQEVLTSIKLNSKNSATSENMATFSGQKLVATQNTFDIQTKNLSLEMLKLKQTIGNVSNVQSNFKTNSAEALAIILIFLVVLITFAAYFLKISLKNIAQKLVQQSEAVRTRSRNSINTIVTFDDSSV